LQKQFHPLKTATLRDVARAAGVSPATASRVFNDNPQVDPAARAAVQAAARQVGYVRSALISSVMREFRRAEGRVHRGTIVLLTFDPPPAWPSLGVCYYQAIYDGVRARAEAQGYGVETTVVGRPGATPAPLGRVLLARGITGVILTQGVEVRHEVAFPWERFTSVLLGNYRFTPHLHRASRDYFRDVQEVWDHLSRGGYRRIGLVTNARIAGRHEFMGLAAVLQKQLELTVSQQVPILQVDELTPAHLTRWRNRHRPDVVVCEESLVYRQLLAAGVHVPEDVGCVCLNPTPDLPELSCLRVPFGEITAAAVDLLTKLMEHRESGIPSCPRAVLTRSVWHDGATLRKPTR
jgi:DNA-binding LacI/PurR family transcriptional regulator